MMMLPLVICVLAASPQPSATRPVLPLNELREAYGADARPLRFASQLLEAMRACDREWVTHFISQQDVRERVARDRASLNALLSRWNRRDCEVSARQSSPDAFSREDAAYVQLTCRGGAKPLEMFLLLERKSVLNSADGKSATLVWYFQVETNDLQ